MCIFFYSRRIPDTAPIVYISSDLGNIAFQARITNISVTVGFRTECHKQEPRAISAILGYGKGLTRRLGNLVLLSLGAFRVFSRTNYN